MGQVISLTASFILPFSKPGQIAALGGKLGFVQKLATDSTLFKAGGALATAGQRTVARVSDMVTKTPNMCFVAGTPVHTSDGLKPIERIRAGDWVLSRDAQTRRQAFQPVRATFVTHPARLYHLTFRAREGQAPGVGSSGVESGESSADDDDWRLSCTGEHPFFVIGQDEFVPASRLAVGDCVSLADGTTARLTARAIEEAPSGNTFTTYNFEVARWHTYFAGRQGVWVHNQGRECEWIRGLFHRLRGRGYSAKQALTVLLNDLTKATGGALKPAALDASKLMYEAGADLARSGHGWSAVKNEVMTVHESKALLNGRIGASRAARAGAVHTGSAFFQHHSVPIAIQERLEQLLGLPPKTWNYDDVPVIFLTKESHMFPDGVHAFLKAERLWKRADMVGKSPQDIVRGLRTAYLNYNDPNGWEVIRVWLKSRSVPFPPDIP